MKRSLYIFAFLLMFSCSSSYAQDDLFGSFTTGKSTSSNVSSNSSSRSSVSNNRTNQQSRSQVASNNNTQKKAPGSQINKRVKSTKTETKGNGSLLKYTYYEDGSYLLYSKSRCSWCGGRGTCIMCSGQGRVLNGICIRCAGSAKCSSCNGSGHVESEQYIKKDGSGWLKDLRTGKVTNVAPSNGDNATVTTTGAVTPKMTTIPRMKSQSGSIYKKCTYCHATGRCSRCNGFGYTDNTLNAEYVQCASCNGSGRCFNCHGRGSY